jgi:hypothetical protein
MAFTRKSYSGPMKDRDEVMRGGKKLADVSKEELGDFRAKFGKDKTLKDLLNADRGSASKADAPKPAAAPKKSTVDTMRDTTAKKYDKKRLEEAKKTATPEPEKDITPRGRMKAAGRSRSEKFEPTVNVPEGGTAVERMKKIREARYGKKSGGTVKMKSGGSVSKRADGIAKKGKTKGRMV